MDANFKIIQCGKTYYFQFFRRHVSATYQTRNLTNVTNSSQRNIFALIGLYLPKMCNFSFKAHKLPFYKFDCFATEGIIFKEAAYAD